MRAAARSRRCGSGRPRLCWPRHLSVPCPWGVQRPGRTRGSRGPGRLLRGVRNAARDPARPRPGGSGRQPRGSQIGDVTWARITQAGIDPRRTQHAPPRARRPAPARSPPHPIPSRPAPRERVLTREIVTRPARTSAGDTISRVARRSRDPGGAPGAAARTRVAAGSVLAASKTNANELIDTGPGNPHGRGDETSALTTRTRLTSSRPSPRSLFSGLMVALSCSGHLRSAGPRWSNRRSRGWNAHLEVRGAAAPGAAVREIVG